MGSQSYPILIHGCDNLPMAHGNTNDWCHQMHRQCLCRMWGLGHRTGMSPEAESDSCFKIARERWHVCSPLLALWIIMGCYWFHRKLSWDVTWCNMRWAEKMPHECNMFLIMKICPMCERWHLEAVPTRTAADKKGAGRNRSPGCGRCKTQPEKLDGYIIYTLVI